MCNSQHKPKAEALNILLLYDVRGVISAIQLWLLAQKPCPPTVCVWRGGQSKEKWLKGREKLKWLFFFFFEIICLIIGLFCKTTLVKTVP